MTPAELELLTQEERRGLAPIEDDPFVVPFFEVARQHRSIRAELDAAFERVFRQSVFILGEEVERFESEFAAHCGAGHAVGVGSGLDALTFALRGLGIGRGDEVITAANSFIATALAIHAAGATPVLVDCDPRTLAIDPAAAAAAITPRTAALIPVHLYGRLVEMPPILSLAGRHGLAVIEDAAQAHGAWGEGGRAGGIGDAGAFSFYPTKNLGALGDGGAIVTKDAALADRLRRLRNYGQSEKYFHPIEGYNSRLDPLQAALLRVKLPRLDAWTEARRRLAAMYQERLAEAPVEVPARPRMRDALDHVFHIFAIELEDRDAARARLHERGVRTVIHYPTPIHRQPAFAWLGLGPGSLPHSERLSQRLLSLPLFPEMTEAQLDRVVSALHAALA